MRVLLALLLLTGCTPPKPDVVLVTWDTVRADRVGPGAAVAGLTPGFDARAEGGLHLTHARAPAPVTLPSHATMLTGLLPHDHGARTNGLFALNDELATLAERFTAGGYHTGAFVSAAVLSKEYGLARGFDHYDDRVQEEPGGTHFARRRGEETVGAALAWLGRQDKREPAFLWVHLFDAHLPLDPPEAFARQHPDPYDASIAYVDAMTEMLLRGVANRRVEPLVVIAADHGEGLGEHGERTHGYFAYDSTLRVPLLFSGPGFAPSSDDRLAHVGDIAPTLLAAAGLPPIDTPDARDLRQPATPRSLAVESIEPVYAYGAAPLFGVYTDEAAWFDAPTPERYDLKADPKQTRNLWTDQDAARAPFAKTDRRWPPANRRGLDDAEKAQLIALGYLSAESGEAPTGGADLKDLLPVASLCMRVEAEALPDEIAAEGEALLSRFGPVPMLAIVTADALSALGRPAEALALLARSAEAHPAEERLTNRLALARRAIAADEALERDIRAAMVANPEHADAPFDLALVVHRLGRLDEAIALYRAALTLRDDVDARLGLARALGGTGDLEEAAAALTGEDARIRCARGTLLSKRLGREAAEDLAACPTPGRR